MFEGDEVIFRCACSEQTQRPMSAIEKRRLRAEDAPQNDIHRVWHDFERQFLTKQGKWRHVGFALMERIEKWAEKYPGDVRIVNCDDDHFASSMLVLIEHRARASYMGTTAVFVPQCTGEPPVQFFLYPRHADRLIAALQEVRKAALVTERRENARKQADMKWWNSRVAAPKKRRPQTARPKKAPRATSA